MLLQMQMRPQMRAVTILARPFVAEILERICMLVSATGSGHCRRFQRLLHRRYRHQLLLRRRLGQWDIRKVPLHNQSQTYAQAGSESAGEASGSQAGSRSRGGEARGRHEVAEQGSIGGKIGGSSFSVGGIGIIIFKCSGIQGGYCSRGATVL